MRFDKMLINLKRRWLLGIVVLSPWLGHSAMDSPGISAFTRDGRSTWTNALSNGVMTVEMATLLTTNLQPNPWRVGPKNAFCARTQVVFDWTLRFC